MTLPGEMNLSAISSSQSHLSTASSVNTANTQGNEWEEQASPSHRLKHLFHAHIAGSSLTHFFSVSGFGVEILPSCSSAVLSLWVLSVPRTVCPGQPTRGGTIRTSCGGEACCKTAHSS